MRVWTLGGDTIYTLSGHTSFVYSLSVLPGGDIVSAGEDRTVRVWKGTSRLPSITQKPRQKPTRRLRRSPTALSLVFPFILALPFHPLFFSYA